MARLIHFLFQAPGSPALVLHSPHAECGRAATVLHRVPQPEARELQGEQVKPLPELIVETVAPYFGPGALDITRVCHKHGWASRKVPVESGVDAPTCELCDVERLYIDGFARYLDLVAKRDAGLL